jgi:tRNA-splicing ligase RtcB
VRLIGSGLSRQEIQSKIKDLLQVLFANIPTGVGSARKDFKLSLKEQEGVLKKGASWAVGRGFGDAEDLEYIEEGGCIPGGDPSLLSNRALERGRPQLGTLGSGNHFVEIGFVEEVYDAECATAMGLYKDQVTIFVHTGSRGLGHQVCDDAIRKMLEASRKYQIELPDKQLCCAPIDSKEGRNYLSAMACAANYAFANRQMITHWVRETFEKVLRGSPKTLQLHLVYDVCHNIAKIETHVVEGEKKPLCIHRKGATRAFPPNHPDIPEKYRAIGQPVLIPGDMGTASYVLAGTEGAFKETFGSACHGAGRVMSRHQAKKVARGRSIIRELEDQGIYVKAAGMGTVVEEMPEAYKDISHVVDIVHRAGISRKVVKLKPMGVIKG